MKGIIGKKLGMTRIFNDQGRAVPVTVIEVGPCPVIQVKTKDSDGYDAIQIGFGKRKEKRTSKPMAGHFVKSGQPATQLLRELRLDDASGFEVGAQLTAELFKVGERVKVTAYGAVGLSDRGMYDDKLVCSRNPLSPSDRERVLHFLRLYGRFKRLLNLIRARPGLTRCEGWVPVEDAFGRATPRDAVWRGPRVPF